jgi:hypothetical protein
VVEGAAFAEWALAFLLHVFACLSLVVGVNCTKSGLSKVLWKWIACLSELGISVSKLAELVEWAGLVLQVVLAELGLVLLLQGVNLALVAVEAIVV